ncbi:FkbM family methyltransferase [Omnitrophica bacterium]|nr:FkbM family methyltransferase [Candidatus Omnitrophota bacterium]
MNLIKRDIKLNKRLPGSIGPYLKRRLKKTYIFLFKPFFKRGISIKIGDAGDFRFDYTFAFSRFNAFGTKHNSGFKKWLEVCKGKRTVFDIGAHIGLYSIPASRVIDKSGLIYAFEPSRANRSYLEKHSRFNGIDNIKIFPCLVGEGSSEGVVFYENNDVDPMNSVKMRKNLDLYNKVSKEQVSLDDFCDQRNIAPEIIKIDVEGSELKVLKGAQTIFKKYNPIVFLSLHPRRLALMDASIEELAQLTDSLSYNIYNTSGQRPGRFEHNEYILIPKKRDIHEIF